MLYSSDELRLSPIDEAAALLEGANYLTESESAYYPEMVPIRENKRLGCKLLRVEDLVEYALANGVDDAGVAVHQICEACGIDGNELAFTVDEVNLLEDVELEDTVRNIISANPNIQFFAAPISENDMASIITNATVNTLAEAMDEDQFEYGAALFEAYVNNDFPTLFSEEYLVENIYQLGRSNSNFNSLNESEDIMNQKIESAMNEAYNNMNAWDAKKISSLRSLSIALDEEGYGNSEIAGYVDQAINHLASKIKS